jgi:hypothetical protein
MDVPPKINQTHAKTVQVEVLPPDGRGPGADARRDGGPPIHALSALLLVAVDNLWLMAEWSVVTWVVTIPASFCTVAFPTFLIQKHLMKDSTGRALAFATLLGALAAVPTSITGTPVGIALLAWTGLSRLLGKGVFK